MEVQNVLHMTPGEGKTSYAMNSEYQKRAIIKAKPIVEEAITDLYCKTVPRSMAIADLGCSSGPNTLLVISEIVEAISLMCQKLGHRSPELQVYLNDLPGNDFNTIFKSIPFFVEKHRTDKENEFGPCFMSGIPGSFYERLFPAETLDFVHSSNSLHYLSQVPHGIENNKGNIYIAATSPPNVPIAYFTQFQMDFTLFLSLRSAELVPGGRMVITILGRRNIDPSSKEHCDSWELLAQSLRDMVYQGLVDEAKLDSFNLPLYSPCLEEVKAVIEEQGSFHLNLLEAFDAEGDTNYDYEKEVEFDDFIKAVSRTVRAVTESMLVSHFGEEILEELFDKYAKYVGQYIGKEKNKYVNLIMSMTKKG
ncbi:hypothetical protein AQUCO_03300127v1 [Aquilegia coerulea]|uniref:Uncharacterized protein n=1 Tax=Aquilegia coerulea TaxID=218851 RepID=A0A2G5CZK3_AQUCA|nr:hypothetical protein AQUCO_03300127v1 [Aquilegia coerulea]